MADVRALRPESLGAVVDLAMQRQGADSGRALSRKAADLGIVISYTVLNGLRRGSYVHPLGREHRKALAALSGLSVRIINDLAGARSLAPFELPERAAELTGEQRTAVLSVVGAFITANEALAEAEAATMDEGVLAEAAYEPEDQEPAGTSEPEPP